MEATILLLRDAFAIPFHFDRGVVYWWPWIKNYYGEVRLQDDCCWSQIMNYLWVDQDLKEEMGY